MTDPITILFVCVHNAGRSQMAAGFAEALSGGAVRVRSGGSEPGASVNPVAVAAMAEVGIDISAGVPQILTVDAVRGADVVVTMGCGDACPIFPGTRYEDWELADPAGLPIERVRPIRDDIRSRVETLLRSLGVPTSAAPPTGRVPGADAVRAAAAPTPFEVHPSGAFLHGTRADLAVGDLLRTGFGSNFEAGRTMRHVYFCRTLDAAVWGAELAVGAGRGRVYLVEPTGPFEDDPNVTDKRFPGNPTQSYRSRDPLRIVGELTDWVGHTPEQLAARRESLDRLVREGAAEILD